jgi:hypothetical protein
VEAAPGTEREADLSEQVPAEAGGELGSVLERLIADLGSPLVKNCAAVGVPTDEAPAAASEEPEGPAVEVPADEEGDSVAKETPAEPKRKQPLARKERIF